MADDANPYVVAMARALRTRGETVSFAESCTGGLLSAVVTRLPGVSDVFEGSIVAYSYPVKEKALGVPSHLLRTHGAVSLPVARRMAEGAREKFASSWALSITGIAGPGGGSEQKPVGTVCFGIVGPGVDEVVQRVFAGDRRAIQRRSAAYALRMLLRRLGVGEVSGGLSKDRKKSRKKS